MRSRSDLVAKLIGASDGSFLTIARIGESDLKPMTGILNQYSDQSFQLADVSLMHVANRDNIQTVLTLDQRDFSIFITDRGSSLQLLPNN